MARETAAERRAREAAEAENGNGGDQDREDQEAISRLGVAGTHPGSGLAGRHPESGPAAERAPGENAKLLVGAAAEAGGKEVKSLSDLADADDSSTTVVLKDAVYEEHDLPGTDIKGTRMLFHKGQRVSKATLAAVEAAQKANKSEHKEHGGSSETK